jgi:WD40 repeat protein
VAFSPDGCLALASSGGRGPRKVSDNTPEDNAVRVWDLETGREVRRYLGHTRPVVRAVFSPDGRFVLSAAWNGSIRQWSVRSGLPVRVWTTPKDAIWDLTFSPDRGRAVVSTANEKTVRLWELPK